ncbi:MAG: hypothetical protein LBU32_32795 [Clostridiales bacterium]|jgi:hypothetical protein|nr:hypothetical protein [Clostridiales bacterium]
MQNCSNTASIKTHADKGSEEFSKDENGDAACFLQSKDPPFSRDGGQGIFIVKQLHGQALLKPLRMESSTASMGDFKACSMGLVHD